MEIPAIPMKMFYGIASVLMGITTIGNIIALKINLPVYNVGNVISSVGGIVMNLLFALMFYGLWKMESKKVQQPQVIDSPEIENMLKELNQQEVKNENTHKDRNKTR